AVQTPAPPPPEPEPEPEPEPDPDPPPPPKPAPQPVRKPPPPPKPAPVQPAPQPRPAPAPAAPAPGPVTEAPAPGTASGPAAGAAGGAPSAGAGGLPGPATAGVGDPNARDSYLAQVQRWLERHKQYPSAARSRRQEGTVVLRFVIDAQGTVLAHRIDRGSGHRLLDDAVEDLIRRASPLPKPPPGVVAQTLEVAVPIVFNLR
ncbi:energy transducer TonB, partial [Caenispirillum bisanense]|uniref:energy transducer TonB n=1 Tax=Caenispirillum bisanense TaxID=414052 RepID=UPI0031DC83B7